VQQQPLIYDGVARFLPEAFATMHVGNAVKLSLKP